MNWIQQFITLRESRRGTLRLWGFEAWRFIIILFSLEAVLKRSWTTLGHLAGYGMETEEGRGGRKINAWCRDRSKRLWGHKVGKEWHDEEGIEGKEDRRKRAMVEEGKKEGGKEGKRERRNEGKKDRRTEWVGQGGKEKRERRKR